MAAGATAIGLTSSATVWGQSAADLNPANLSSTERAELAAMMAEHLQLTLAAMTPEEGQRFPTKVTACFNDEGRLLVDLGRRFLFRTDGTHVGRVDLQLESFDALMYTEEITGTKLQGIDYLFEGRDLDYYLPERIPGGNVVQHQRHTCASSHTSRGKRVPR